MEFGALPNVDHVDWNLPATPESSKSFFSSSSDNLEVIFGAPAWGHKVWIGKIYPTGAKPGEFLSYYAKSFGCVELNTSHYRIPTVEQAKKWLELVPSDFLFCPKIYQGISHSQAGLQDKDLLAETYRFLESLGTNCGSSFIQLPPYFDYSQKQFLFSFLSQWPDDFKLSIELRHSSWFDKQTLLPALTEYLHRRGMNAVITDVAGRRDILHSSLSTDFAFLRLILNDLHPSDLLRADLWAEKLLEWKKLGLKRIYFMVHEPDDILTPEMASKLAPVLAKSLDQKILFPRFETAAPDSDSGEQMGFDF